MEKLAPICERYSPELAQQLGRILVDRFASYLRDAQTGPAGFAFASEDLEQLANAFLTSGEFGGIDPVAQTTALIEAYCRHTRVLHSPRYMGHQVPPPSPLGGLMQGVALALNQGLAIEEMGPFAAAIERALIKRMLNKVGFSSENGHGIVTSGGTLANLTAMLAARHHKRPGAWRDGGAGPLKIVTSEHAHYCMARAMGVMGLGDQNIVKVPGLRMTEQALRASLAMIDPEEVMAVVASAPSTPMGLIDDIAGIGRVCTEFGLWLHVDAVHGASLLFSEQYRDRLTGIAQADSVSWDAHKMLHVPSLTTFLLYKDKRAATGAFQQQASYLFNDEEDQWRLDPAYCTFECTRPSMVTGLWAVWSVYGEAAFAQTVDACMAVTEGAYELLRERPGFYVGPHPDTNILCFRWLPDETMSLAAANALQLRLRERLLKDGTFYITTAEVEGVRYLRLTLINPLTTIAHIGELCDYIEVLHRTG